MGFFDAVSNTPSTNVTDYVWLLYGPPGIGKTTFAAEGDYLLIAFERGFTAMEASAVDLTMDTHPDPRASEATRKDWAGASIWQRFEATVREIIQAAQGGTLPWAGICIDTVDGAWVAAVEHVCKQRGWESIDDGGDYGKGYVPVNDTFRGALVKLMRLGVGLGFVSHSRDREFKGRGKIKYDKIVPTLPPSTGKWVFGQCDLVLYADAVPGPEGKAMRVVHTQPSFRFDAKARGRRSSPLPSPLFLDYRRFSRVFERTMKGDVIDTQDLPIVSEDEAVPEPKQSQGVASWPST